MTEEVEQQTEDLQIDDAHDTGESPAPNEKSSHANSGRERRIYKRATINLGVKIHLSDGSYVHAKIVNISVAGVGLIYDMPAEMNAKLGLEFNILSEDRDVTAIKLQSIVRHTHLANNRYYIGLQFLNVPEETESLINTFVNKLSVRNLSII